MLQTFDLKFTRKGVTKNAAGEGKIQDTTVGILFDHTPIFLHRNWSMYSKNLILQVMNDQI